MNQVNLCEWRDVDGYEGKYQVSPFGEVRSLKRWNGRTLVDREEPLVLKKTKSTTGYYKVELFKNGVRKSRKVHRLVAEAYVPNVDGKPCINHIDGNPVNNNANNLEWCTQQENVCHAIRTGLRQTVQYNFAELEELYRNNVPITEIAEKYGVSKQAVYSAMKRNNVDIKPIGESQKKYDIDLTVLREELKSFSVKELASKYGCPTNLISVRKYQFRKEGLL